MSINLFSAVKNSVNGGDQTNTRISDMALLLYDGEDDKHDYDDDDDEDEHNGDDEDAPTWSAKQPGRRVQLRRVAFTCDHCTVAGSIKADI